MALEGEQLTALNLLRGWWNDPQAPQSFVLMGAAGTGKSFTLSVFMSELGIDPSTVMFCTLSGKAALVLRNRGIESACTIHSLIYIPYEHVTRSGKTEMRFRKRSAVDPQIKLIVIDECSMIDNGIIDDVLSYKTKVIFVGDKFQLKPISGVNSLMNQTPDAELTTPRRQALDNSILRVATDIRQGNTITQYGMIGNNVLRVDMDFINKNQDILKNAEQVICGANKTRHGLNNNIRNLLGFKQEDDESPFWLPCNKDKVICTRNNHALGLINGQIGYITYLHEAIPTKDYCKFNFVDTEGNRYNNTKSVLDLFERDINYEDFTFSQKAHQQFQFGYAITAHKSQGSEWSNIVVFEEITGSPYLNWLYTAVTRAKINLIMVEC